MRCTAESFFINKQTILLIACDCYKSWVTGWPCHRHTFTARAQDAFTGHVVHRSRAFDGTAAPHWEITQRWDLMALRLSASKKTTSDLQPWPLLTPPILQGPVPVIGHLSNSSHWSDYGLILGSADYTLLGSRQAPFSNFTWQQIAELLWEE